MDTAFEHQAVLKDILGPTSMTSAALAKALRWVSLSSSKVSPRSQSTVSLEARSRGDVTSKLKQASASTFSMSGDTSLRACDGAGAQRFVRENTPGTSDTR